MMTTLTSLSRRELDRVVDRYPWFTTARRARAVVTGKADEALALPLLFWPTVANALDMPLTKDAIGEGTGMYAQEDKSADVNGLPSEENTLAIPAVADEQPVVAAPRRMDVELVDRFIDHGNYRIAPDGEAAEVKVDVDIAPEMVSPRLAEIYRAQGLTAEAEKVERILRGAK